MTMTETTNAARKMSLEFDRLSLHFIDELLLAFRNDDAQVSEQLAEMTKTTVRIQSTLEYLDASIGKIDELRIMVRRKGFKVVKSG